MSCRAQLYRLSGHAEDQGTLLVLCDGHRSTVSHGLEPLGPISSHARQNHSGRSIGKGARNGLEKVRNRGAQALDWRIPGEFDAAALRYAHVCFVGCKINMSGLQLVALNGNVRRQFAGN